MENQIKQEFSIPRRQYQNGTIERNIRTITEIARSLIIQSNLPKEFWLLALECAAYIKNRSTSRIDKHTKTPYENFTIANLK